MRVWVYRNLRHPKDCECGGTRKDKPLYSVMRNGRVIARSHRVYLKDCEFRVREGGRKRVVSTKRKNVHAFVIGTPVGRKGAFGQDKNGRDLPARIRYNPYEAGHFKLADTNVPVQSARAVLLNENGMSACYTHTGERFW